MGEKIEVGFKLIWKMVDIDFGMLSENYRDGAINVDKELWERYVDARYEFEELHAKLTEMFRKTRRSG